jgi:hypothetical protein
MINPALDVWVWATFGVFLVLMATRAWLAETRQARLGRTTTGVKVLAGSTAVTVCALAVLLSIQGGTLLVESIVNKTDPSTAYYGTVPDPAAPAAPAPTPVPAAPPP